MILTLATMLSYVPPIPEMTYIEEYAHYRIEQCERDKESITDPNDPNLYYLTGMQEAYKEIVEYFGPDD